MPLLYTMEVWQHGVSFHPLHLLATFVLIFGLNLVFSFFAGVRERYSANSFTYAVEDAITAMGLGVVIALAVLWLIGRIDPGPKAGTTSRQGGHRSGIVSVGIAFTNFNSGEDRR